MNLIYFANGHAQSGQQLLTKPVILFFQLTETIGKLKPNL